MSRKNIVSKVWTLFLVVTVMLTCSIRSTAESKFGEPDNAYHLRMTVFRDYEAAYQMLAVVNEERAKVGLGPVYMDEELLETAMTRAAEIQLLYSHTRPDGSYALALSTKVRAENLNDGYNQQTPSAAVKGWMDSPGHRANILNGYYTSIGIGCVKIAGYTRWAQVFGTNPLAENCVQPKNYEFQQTVAASAGELVIFESHGTEKASYKFTIGALSLAPGDEEQAIIIALIGTHGGAVVTSDDFKWSSSNTEILSVNETGKVTANKEGVALLYLYSRVTGENVAIQPVQVTGTAEDYLPLPISLVPDPAEGIQMHRLYYEGSHEHLYTMDKNEVLKLTAYHNWKYERGAWVAPAEGTPVYRLYNPFSGDHHYTMDLNEYETLGRQGWNQEGICWRSAGEDGTPVYRLFAPGLETGSHHYTTDTNERTILIKSGFWIDEGIGWYGN